MKLAISQEQSGTAMSSNMNFTVGVDVGGTFTDLMVRRSDGEQRLFKTLTTPQDPAIGFFDGLARAAAGFGRDVEAFPGEIDTIVHGTTITTNAALTGNVAAAGFLTTAGFRDILNMRRGLKTGARYDLRLTAPPPLVPRRLVLTATERVDASGAVITPLAEEEVAAAAEVFAALGVEAVGISFLWSFLNPAHEQRARDILQALLPDTFITISSEVLPQIRAYERHSTTALNACVSPLLARYLERLETRLADSGFSGRLFIMQSGGGVMTPRATARLAVNTLLSGPAGAPAASLWHAAEHGFSDIITADMGGTSFDVSLIQNGEAVVTSDNEIGGHHVGVPMLDIHTIGAGGGSIAHVDAGGILHVGPASAGAEPGPACYGRGGTEPTVTDADLVLGYIAPSSFHGGEMMLDAVAAEAAIRLRVAEPLGMDTVTAANGIYRLANSLMSGAVSVVTVQRGHDPREFAMICAGGAGPVHAVAIAREIGIGTVLVPKEASVFCAAGMLISDIRQSFVRTCASEDGSLDLARVTADLAELAARAESAMADQGIPADALDLQCAADLRYVGQFHEVAVPGFPGGEASPAVWEAMLREFHARHDRLFGYALPDAAVELINLRLAAVCPTPRPQPRRSGSGIADASHAARGTRRAWFDDGFVQTPVYDALALQAGNRIEGPALVEQQTSTIVLPPGSRLDCDPCGNYVIHTGSGREQA